MNDLDSVLFSVPGEYSCPKCLSPACRGKLSVSDSSEDEADRRGWSGGLERGWSLSVQGSHRDVLRQLLRHRPAHRHQDLQTGDWFNIYSQRRIHFCLIFLTSIVSRRFTSSGWRSRASSLGLRLKTRTRRPGRRRGNTDCGPLTAGRSSWRKVRGHCNKQTWKSSLMWVQRRTQTCYRTPGFTETQKCLTPR